MTKKSADFSALHSFRGCWGYYGYYGYYAYYAY